MPEKHLIVIAIALGLLVLAGLALFVRARMQKGSKNRRRSDKSPSSKDRMAFQKAKELFAQGQPLQAAQLLESVGLIRESINLLQESGHIDEAADMLLRMGRPNRAGVIYTRHGRWEKAVECFKMANMPIEVARCAREAGDFETAAAHFLKTDHFSEAADCYAEQGDKKKAARYKAKAGNTKTAIRMYLEFIEDSDAPLKISFDPEELDFIVDAVVRGNTAVAFAQVLEANDRLTDAITNLVRFGNVDGAAKLYSFANDDIDQHLIDSVGISETAGKNLGELFRHLGKTLQAARTFEKIEMFEQAAEAYEEAGAYKNAAKCFKATNKQDKYLEMRSKNSSFDESAAEPTAKLKASEFAGLEATQQLKKASAKKAVQDAADAALASDPLPEQDAEQEPEQEPETVPEAEPEDEVETYEAEEDDARALTEATLELAKRGLDESSIDENDATKIDPEQVEDITLEEDLDGEEGSSPKKAIPLSADLSQPPPMIERKPEKKKKKDVEPEKADVPEPPSEAKAPEPPPEPAEPSLKQVKEEDSLRPTEPMFKKRPPDDEEEIDNRGGNLPDERYKVKAKDGSDEGTYDNTEMDEVFARSKILYDLKKAEKRLLWKLGETVSYKRDDIMLEPNQTPRGIFFVLSGSISVSVGPNATNEGRREIYPGETFAAHWAFLDELIEARFKAKETTHVRVISREDLQFLLDNNGTLARKLYKNMTRQIRFDFLTNQNNKGINQAS